MSTECPICFEMNDTTVQCTQCNNAICLKCFSQLDKCAFCRKSYYARDTIDEIFRGCERINRAIERLEQVIRRLS